MRNLTERYLEYYTPLIQEFIKNVELLPIPDLKVMPESEAALRNAEEILLVEWQVSL